MRLFALSDMLLSRQTSEIIKTLDTWKGALSMFKRKNKVVKHIIMVDSVENC